MALNSINTNVSAYFAQQNINKANNMTSSSIGRLSSGNRIVRASDDVAAMSVGTSLRTTVSTLKMGLLNASQGSSMLQVADGALGKMQDMLLRQKALATQATSGSLTSAERGFLNQEFQNLTQEIDRLVQNTNFNGVKLLDGTLGGEGATTLLATDAAAAAMTAAGGVVAAGAQVIQAFNQTTGASASGNTAGQLQFVQSDGLTQIADAEYATINQAVYGEIGPFKLDNLVTNSSAEISVEINGIEFKATVGHDAAGTSFVLKNGNTYIEFGAAAGNLDFTSQVTAQAGINALNTAFANIAIYQHRTVDGVDFTGTRLAGVTGNALTNAPVVRTMDAGELSISNFRYVGNSGAAGTNILSVQVGGETWTTQDTVADAPAGVLTFLNDRQEAMQIDLNGLTTALTGSIQTNLNGEREALINALNQAFSNIGGGVDFALGTERSDSLTVSIQSSTSGALYGNKALDITTVASAQEAGEVLNDAIDMVTSIRADVGAMMSRFDFATANIEIAMQNQDAARGVLLDTDVAAESSAYATAQVQLQAGIAVLAQANQLPQNLLKLIG